MSVYRVSLQLATSSEITFLSASIAAGAFAAFAFRRTVRADERIRFVGAHLESPDAFAFAPKGFRNPTTTAFASSSIAHSAPVSTARGLARASRFGSSASSTTTWQEPRTGPARAVSASPAAVGRTPRPVLRVEGREARPETPANRAPAGARELPRRRRASS
jgi:hypothetical protein